MNKITNGLSLEFPETFMESANVFGDYESDFYRYMVTQGNLAPKTSRDYISRLRFLSQNYFLDDDADSYNYLKVLYCYHLGLHK